MTVMTSQATTPVGNQGKPGTRGPIGMTALTLVMLGGVVLWQLRQDGAVTTGRAPAPAQQVAMADQHRDPTVTVGRLTGAGPSGRTGRADTTVTVYLAGSATQADQLQRSFAEAAAGRLQRGRPALDETVVIGPGAEAGEDAMPRLLWELDDLYALGLPGMVVVDLRSGPPEGAPDAAP
jgi:hypothetical protein